MKHRTTFVKLLRSFFGRSKDQRTVRAICLLLFLSTSFIAYSQITVNLKDLSLRASLKKIEQVSSYKFFYNENLPELNQKVSISVQNVTIDQTMQKLLEAMQLTYQQEKDNVIVLVRKAQGKQVKQITGKVVDTNGEPIIGASVAVKGTSIGTITDINGRYNLANVPESSTVSISYIGFATANYLANSKNLAHITLREDSKMIDEVVVVGYGVQRKRDVSTAIASLRSSDIENSPATSLEQAMVGRMAGVQVTQSSGAPGSGMNIKVRGTGTITAGSNPLYVIDGVPLEDGEANATGMQISPLASLNPNDVESIEVLKDASSAAIYGSRGSNGVVLISTKSGKAGKPTVNYDGYFGFQQANKKIDVLNAYEYSQLVFEGHNAAYRQELERNGISTEGVDRDANEVRWAKLKTGAMSTNQAWMMPDQIWPYINGEEGLINTDWQDAVMKTGFLQNHSLSVGGGTKDVTYFFSGNYRDEDGVVIGSGYSKFGGRGKVDAKYNKFKFGTNFSTTRTTYALVNSEGRYGDDGVLSAALGAAPLFPVRNVDGKFNYDQYNYGYGNTNILNPVAIASLIKDEMIRIQLQASGYAKYEIIKGLDIKTELSLSYNNFVRKYYRPGALPTSANKTPPSNPTAESRLKNKYTWTWENTLNYNRKFKKKHSLNAILGYTVQKYRQDANRITATDLPNNDLYETIPGKSTVKAQDSSLSEWALLSFLGRAQYGFKDKYIASVALRSDGSSRFGKNNRWGYFPSLSTAWYVSEEKFMKGCSNWLSSLKLRASWGVTGNFSIGDYAAMATIDNDNYLFGNPGAMVVGMKENAAGNPDLGWEKTSMFNFGVEIGLLNWLNLELDVYKGTTRNMLLDVPVLEYSGYSTVLQNIGKLSNKGVEFSLSTNNHIGAVTWQNRFNISMNRNKVLSLGSDATQMITTSQNVIDFITKVGEPIGNYYTLVADGVYKNQAEIETDVANGIIVPNVQPGDFRYKKLGDDDTIDTTNDRAITGNYMPDFTYGFSTSLSWKNLDLSCSLQGVYGNEVANINKRYLANMEGNANQLGLVRNRWVSEDNPGNGYIYRANRSGTGLNSTISSYHIEDGSYLRIRDITLGYTLPKISMKKTGIQRARIYCTAYNPFTFTQYSGYNPEVSIDSSPIMQGVDYGTYPLSRSYIVGINLSF